MNVPFARFAPSLLIAILSVAFLSVSCQTQAATAVQNESGRVFVDGSWHTPEDIAQVRHDDKVLNEYVQIRDQSPDTEEGQIQLARWCDDHSLSDQRTAHLKRALMHNPENRRVRSLLGHVNVNGVWYTAEQVENHKNQIAAINQRYRDWRVPVNKIARLLRSRSESNQKSGLKKLQEVNNSRAVTALEIILASVNEPVALQAVAAIDRFPEREATESLARIALLSPSDAVREQSLDLLASRNRYDYVPDLIGELVSPISSRYSITQEPNGSVLYQYVLYQQNMEQDIVRQFDLWMVQNPGNVGAALEASRRATIAESSIRQLNDFIDRKNNLIQYSLRRVTGASPGDAPEDWWRWWYDENEIYASERPVSFTRVQQTEVFSSPQLPTTGECLVSGTPIWTEHGPRPVESLQIGDRVLCQDLDSNELEYRTVLYPTTRPETPTFRIELNDESIRASGGHLFWVAGQGWTKTRDLRKGMSLETASGVASEIKQIQRDETLPLYNLVVDRNANYFVGINKILSHDSTILARGAPSVEQTPGR